MGIATSSLRWRSMRNDTVVERAVVELVRKRSPLVSAIEPLLVGSEECVNHGCVFRLYCEVGFVLRRRVGKRVLRADVDRELGVNKHPSYDCQTTKLADLSEGNRMGLAWQRARAYFLTNRSWGAGYSQ